MGRIGVRVRDVSRVALSGGPQLRATGLLVSKRRRLMSRTASTYLVAAVILLSPRWLAAQQGAAVGHWEGSFSGPNGPVAVQVDLSLNAQGTLVGMLAAGEVQGVPVANLAVEDRVVRFDI